MKSKAEVDDLWGQDLEDSYNPGISVFKGVEYDLTKISLQEMKDDKQALFTIFSCLLLAQCTIVSTGTLWNYHLL